jgi:pseudouridine-5'-phosphate glycosidase
VTAGLIDLRPDIAAGLTARRPVVALESTLITHGLPWPVNVETARAAEAAIRDEGAVPATIAVLQGRPTIGLHDAELVELAQAANVLKASRRDLPFAVLQAATAATTVAATMYLAHRAGIRLFATGGIGGAHREPAHTWDVSADLRELARTPVAVVCAGAKSILDIPRTLEILETHSVPVVGYGTDEFPAFFLRSSGSSVSARVDTPDRAAAFLAAHWRLDGAGVVVAQPVAMTVALEQDEFDKALAQAEKDTEQAGVRGPALTPYLLERLAEWTKGKTLLANQQLIVANAKLAAQVATCLTSLVQ